VQHPALQAYMPTFMGTLSSNNETPSLLSDIQNSGGLQLPQPGMPFSVGPTSLGTPSEVPGVTSIPASVPQQETPWVPSGGRKLDTGVSIVLENVASGFRRPSVLDVKLGSRLWADDAPASKRVKLDAVSQETTSHSLGFRIAGMKVWVGDKDKSDASEKEVDGQKNTDTDASEGEKPKPQIIEKDGYRRYDKWYGRSFNDQNVKEGFEAFLSGTRTGKTDHSKLVAKRLANEIRRIQTALELEESRMYSASVLIIYESDPEAFEQALEDEKTREKLEAEGDDEDLDDELTDSNGLVEVVDLQATGGDIEQGSLTVNLESDPGKLEDILVEEEDEPSKVHDVRLIDFAHASWTPGKGPDKNALHGVKNLLRIMEELAEA
jgi:1D-myo-inositol-tetrakisphosphate 5-kinase/inositol-polyphosphate multikinase